jgi:hypothetical protein
MKVLEVAVRVSAGLDWYPCGGTEIGRLLEQAAAVVQLRLGVAVEVVASGLLGHQIQVSVDLRVGGRQVGHRSHEPAA